MAFGNAKTPDRSGVFTKEERKNEKDIEESFVYIVSRSCEEKKGISIKFLWSYVKRNGEPDLAGEEKTAAGSRGGPRGNYNKCLSTWLSKATNWCLSLRSSGQLTVDSWQLWYPLRGLFEKIVMIIIGKYSEKSQYFWTLYLKLSRRDSLTVHCPLSTVHSGDSPTNTNLSNGWVKPISALQHIARLQNPKGQAGSDE